MDQRQVSDARTAASRLRLISPQGGTCGTQDQLFWNLYFIRPFYPHFHYFDQFLTPLVFHLTIFISHFLTKPILDYVYNYCFMLSSAEVSASFGVCAYLVLMHAVIPTLSVTTYCSGP